jgi:hypothetical protein
MRSSWVILVVGLLAACSSTPDFCDQFSTAFLAQENSIGACSADAGENANAALSSIGGEFPFSTQSCEHHLTACDAADVQSLNAELKCIKALPAFDCDWLDITDGGTDGGLENYQAAIQNCEGTNLANLSISCQASLDGGGCGPEAHSPNNTVSAPLPLNLGLPTSDCLGIIDGGSDTHYLSITAPSSNAGGYFEISIDVTTTGVEGQLNVKLADPFGNNLTNADYNIQTNAGIFLAVEPGAKFLIEVTSDSGNIPLGYVITASFVQINDSYKPDRLFSQVSAAATLVLGQPTAGAYCWAGQVNSVALVPSENGDFDDWFSVSMPGPGTATISLEGFPGDFAPGAEFVEPNGTTIVEPEICTGCTSNRLNQINTPIYYKAQVTGQGLYFVHVFPNQVERLTYATYSMGTLQQNPVLPAHFTTPYNLTVSFGTP